jgi:hypothetical protein
MFRVRDGRVVEQWAELDMLGLLQQIGAVPAWLKAPARWRANAPRARPPQSVGLMLWLR